MTNTTIKVAFWLFIANCLLKTADCFCQNIGINSNGTSPDNSAMLDVAANNRGLLIPRVSLTSTTDNTTITGCCPASLLVYNTNAAMTGGGVGYYYWEGAKWVAMGGSGGLDWSLLGNAGTVAGTNFIGTTDATDFVIGTTNLERMRVAAAGNIGIGITSPSEKLHVVGNTRVSTLAGVGTRVVQADANGTMVPLAAGTTSQVLLGDGTWGSIPSGSGNYIQNQTAADQVAGFRISGNGLFNGGQVTIGTATPGANYLLTMLTSGNLNGLSMTLAGASATAYGLNISAGNANYRSIFATNSSAAAGVFYEIGATLTAGTTAEGYLCYRSSAPKTYGVYAKGGDYAGYFTNKVTITDNTSPDGTADLEVQNPASGSGNPATLSLRPNNQITVAGNVMTNLNFGSSYSANPQAQIQVIREAASSGSADLPTAIAFSTTPDASATLTERMRITSGGQLGLNTTDPNRMGNATDRTLTIESTSGSHVELMRITSSAGAEIGSFNFDRIASANGAITGRAAITGETVNGNDASLLRFHTMAAGGVLSPRMTITDAGNVGIGIATGIASKLQVYNTSPALLINSYSQFVPALTADQNANLHASWNTIIPGSSFNINADLYGAVNRIEATSSQTGTITGAYGSTNDVYNSGTGTVAGAFGSANYVRNISTGTITNAYGLQANVTNAGTGTITNGYGILISTVQATNKYSLYSTDATAPSYFAGNVSIGDPTAYARLDVKGSGSTNATYGFGVRNSSDAYSLVVADNGYVGIGTVPAFAAPQMPLHLHSAINNFHAIRLTSENTAKYWDIIKRGNTYPQPDNFVIAYWNGGSWQEEFQITPAGNFGMGVNNPANKLEVAGNIWATGDIYLGACGVWLSPIVCSDIRYKKDIIPMKDVLPDVMKLEGIKYNWRKEEFPDKHFDDRRQIGFIAQEMEKVFPEIVNTNDNGYKSIDYAKLTPVLVEAIKELKAENDSLKVENSALQNEMKNLKEDMEKIKIMVATEASK